MMDVEEERRNPILFTEMLLYFYFLVFQLGSLLELDKHFAHCWFTPGEKTANCSCLYWPEEEEFTPI